MNLFCQIGYGPGIGARTRTEARLGDDEFAVILSTVADSGTAQHVAEDLIERLRRSEHLRHGNIQVGASIGIALYPEHADTVDRLMRTADLAMYDIKRQERLCDGR